MQYPVGLGGGINEPEKLALIEKIIEFYTLRAFKTNAGVKGYIKIAVIKILHMYSNIPIMFEVSGREWSMPAQLYVRFTNAASVDPAIDSFKYTGEVHTDVALCKLDTSTWALYVYKDDAYDSICIHRYNYDYNFQNFEIHFPGDFAATLPAGAVNPTLLE